VLFLQEAEAEELHSYSRSLTSCSISMLGRMRRWITRGDMAVIERQHHCCTFLRSADMLPDGISTKLISGLGNILNTTGYLTLPPANRQPIHFCTRPREHQQGILTVFNEPTILCHRPSTQKPCTIPTPRSRDQSMSIITPHACVLPYVSCKRKYC